MPTLEQLATRRSALRRAAAEGDRAASLLLPERIEHLRRAGYVGAREAAGSASSSTCAGLVAPTSPDRSGRVGRVSAKAPDRAEAVGGSRIGGVGGRIRSAAVDARAQRRRVRMARRRCRARSLLLAVVVAARPAARARAVRADRRRAHMAALLRTARRAPGADRARALRARAARRRCSSSAACWLLRGRRVRASCRRSPTPLGAGRARGVRRRLHRRPARAPLRNRVHRRQRLQRDGLLHARRRSSSRSRCCALAARARARGAASRADRSRDARDAARGARRDRRRRRSSTLAYLLSAFNTDGTINVANVALWDHIGVLRSTKPFSILNGQAPLVDFHAQYGHLWAYIAAGGADAVRRLARRLRRDHAGRQRRRRWRPSSRRCAALVGGSSLPTLALFLPFLATSFFMKVGPPDNRYSPAEPLQPLPDPLRRPLRAAVAARAAPRRRARRGGRCRCSRSPASSSINNPEFGVPAVGATLVALAWTLPDRSLRGARAAGGSRRSPAARSRVALVSRADARGRRRPAALRHAAAVPAHLRHRRLRRCCRCRRSASTSSST